MATHRWLAIILFIALAVRLGAAAWWHARQAERVAQQPGASPFGFPDSGSYWTLASALAAGQPYEYGGPEARVFRTPGYPLLLATVVVAAGSGQTGIAWARVESAVFGTLAVAGVCWLGTLVQGWRCGLIAAAIAALMPELIGLSVFVLSEAPFCPLMVAQLALTVQAWLTTSAARSHGLAVAAGLAAAGASLMRPSWLLFVPFSLAIGLAVGPDRARQVRLGLSTLAGLLALMAPWWIRNAAITGHFVPTSLQVGASLYDGWNPQATGASDMSHGDVLAAEFRRDWLAAGRPFDTGEFEWALDQHLRSAALTWAAKHPQRALELAAIKFGRIWNIWPNEASFRSLPLRLAVVCSFGPLLACAVWGVIRLGAWFWPTVLLCLPAIYFTCLHMIFVGSIRYRQPALLPLCVLAAAAIVLQIAAHYGPEHLTSRTSQEPSSH